MNVQLPVHMDKPAFLAWMQQQEGRYELAGGRVVMMVGATRAHAMIVRNLVVLLCGQVDPQKWTVVADFGLDAGPETLRYPDIVVDQAGGGDTDYTATAPVLLIEVLSPSSESVDLKDKASEYLQLPSVLTYLVFAQREPKAWAWSRGEDGFKAEPDVITGSDKIVRIAALNVSLPLAAVYAGVAPL
jgi:Uma2 family endonuclease